MYLFRVELRNGDDHEAKKHVVSRSVAAAIDLAVAQHNKNYGSVVASVMNDRCVVSVERGVWIDGIDQ